MSDQQELINNLVFTRSVYSRSFDDNAAIGTAISALYISYSRELKL